MTWNNIGTNMSAIVETHVVQSEAAAVMSVIERAARDGNIEVAERMLAMQERILARNAELAFNESMRASQEEMPKVLRNKRNEQTNSKYADLEKVNDAIVPVYTKHGFSLSFGTDSSSLEGHIGITCMVSHVQGHSRPYRCDMPLDLVGLKGNANKTATHAHGSTMSYGRRYLALLIFNVTLTNEDRDGNQKSDRLTTDQVTALNDLIKEVAADRARFLAYIGADSVESIPAAKFNTAKAALESKRGAK